MIWLNCWIARNIGKIKRSWVELGLFSSIEYHIWLADPNFFILGYNPSGTPSIWQNHAKVCTTFLRILCTCFGLYLILCYIKFEEQQEFAQFIYAEKISLLNRKKAPCTKYENFNSSFTECVIEKAMKKIGCKVSM